MKKMLFIDMDGTIAEWKTGATLEEVRQPRYSFELGVNGNTIKALDLIYKEAKKYGSFDVYILSAVFFDTTALEDKNGWLDKFCPYIQQDHRLFVPCGENKAEFVMNKLQTQLSECYLLDDYSSNLKQWKEAGGHPIKMFNRINGKSMSYAGGYTCSWLDPEQMKNDVLRIMGLLADTDIREIILNLINENAANLDDDGQTNYGKGYAEGYQDALVDVLYKLNWADLAEEIGYFN